MNRRKRQRVNDSQSKRIIERAKAIDWRDLQDRTKDLAQRGKTDYLGLPNLHKKLIPALAVIVLLLLFVPVPTPPEPSTATPTRVELDIDTRGLSQQQATPQTNKTTAPATQSWTEYVVKDGDTLAAVFRSNGLPTSDLNALVRIEGSDKPLSRIRKGQLVRFKLDAEGRLDILQLERGNEAVMFFRLSDGGFGRSK